MQPDSYRIISGGQTGVDRAALDVGAQLGLPTGGWCPRGRLAEDGQVPAAYPLEETPSDAYEQRTMWNVRDADATLLLAVSAPLTGGTLFTQSVAEGMQKPHMTVILDDATSLSMTAEWLRRNRTRVLNVAGPRESSHPGIQQRASQFLTELFHLWISREENPDMDLQQKD
ncbi:putative molybdenum carrier protein [bacterium]|nr:putative molybdenum carrier protein [bacterium]